MKTFQQFIEQVNTIKPLTPYRVMPPLKTKEGEYNPSPQRFLINPKTGFGPGIQQAQMAPSKSMLVGPTGEQLPHMDQRKPGELLRNLQLQKQFYDKLGKTPPTV